MKLAVLVLISCFASWLASAQTGAITIWKGGVPPGGMQQKADFGNHLLETIHRDRSGQAELHKIKADVIVIQKGSATLLTGGDVIDPKDTEANEVRGSGINGGSKHEVAAGDVIDIPAGVPHQFLLDPGAQITYLVVKVVKH